MSHEHDWGYSWRSTDGCICGSCTEVDKPYLWCEFCDDELEPGDPDFDTLWKATIARY